MPFRLAALASAMLFVSTVADVPSVGAAGVPAAQSAHLQLEQPALDLQSLSTPAGSDVAARQAIEEHPTPGLSLDECQQIALELVNARRTAAGMTALQPDSVGAKIAQAQVAYLSKTHSLSHLDPGGENPDVRYTNAGGEGCLTESLATVCGVQPQGVNPAVISALIDQMMSHQDDRDSLMSPDATSFGFCVGTEHGRAEDVACAEVITTHASLKPIPEHLAVGAHINIAGEISAPYRFDKITLAWEGGVPTAISSGSSLAENTDVSSQSDEEVPYFPPLDYAAYLTKVPRDRRKLYGTLKVVGVVAALVGNAFVPGVALAAIPIMLIPIGRKGGLQAASDVPLHGGIRVRGSDFSGSIPISYQGKPGLYYVTVWATDRHGSIPVSISRRTILVTPTGA